MIVEYTLAPSDYVAFSLYHHAHTPAMQKSMRRLRFAIPAIWLALGLYPLLFGGSIGATEVVYFAVAFLWVLLVPSLIRGSVRRTAARWYERGIVNGQIGLHRVELTDTGFRDSTPVTDWHVAWAAVDRVAEDEQHLFVYVGPHAAHIIPKAALGDRLDTFRDVIAQRSAKRPPT
jgi:hypothetical protein